MSSFCVSIPICRKQVLNINKHMTAETWLSFASLVESLLILSVYQTIIHSCFINAQFSFKRLWLPLRLTMSPEVSSPP